MNTRKILLKSTAKALMIAVLICAAGMMKVAKAQSAWEQSQNYLFYLVYADYQVREHIMPQWEYPLYDAIRRNLLPRKEDQGTQVGLWEDDPNLATLTSGLIGLAKNETEGFQVFFREQEKERNLKIVVDTFRNSQNEVLQHTVYWEEFFWPEGVWSETAVEADSLAEALVPYAGEVKRTSVGHNKVFYVELKSTKNQTPGEYTSTVTAYDGDSVINTRTVIAKVWNFALPDSHYSEVVMGLYNRNSGYWNTSSLFTLNGIPVDNNGNVAEEYLDEAKQILNGYQECLLEHGVSTYELPRWLMEEDPKEAELAMADPRRKVFEVPVHRVDLSGSSFNEWGVSVLNQYKDIVYNNDFLKDKAFFYPMDEPDWSNQETVNTFNNVCAALSESWPGYHAVIPFYSEYFTTVQGFEGKIDILCPNQATFDPNVGGYSWAEERLQDFKTRNHTWRYQGDGQCGGIYGYISALAPVGTMRRVLFWQQCAINSDGFLNWNCALLPHDWTKKQLPAAGYSNNVYQTGNGDGILLYPGTMFGQDADKPVVSLRLKQLAEGIDDYDYLRLAEEFLDENDEYGMNASLDRVFWNYPNLAYLCYIINRQKHPEWQSYYAGNCKWMNQARHLIGEALSAANTEHNWGEWETAVLPDETHDGLEIRTCLDSCCHTQESRPKTFLYRFLGTEDNQWSNLANWEFQPESLPTLGEAVIIASDCQVDTSQTVSSVKVKDGYTLTIKDGATLTSRLISTEENVQIIIEDGGQLIHNSNGVMATVKKNVIGHSADDGGYVFISTPTADDADPSQVSGLLTGDYDFYRFDATASDGLEWRNYKNDSFNMSNGIGYLYSNPNDVELNFTGTVRASNTPEVKTPSFSEGYIFGGWNLLGNPFTCNAYLSTDAEGMAFYRMNAEGNGYEAATGAIRPMEGFFVQATSADQSFNISKEQPERIRSELQLRIVKDVDNPKAQHVTDNAIIRFGIGNTLEKISFREHNAKLYIPQDGKDYAVVNADSQGELPIHFEATENGTYTLNISIEDVNFSYLHLIDNQTKADVDLLQTSSYSFEAKVTDDVNRFKVVYSISTTK